MNLLMSFLMGLLATVLIYKIIKSICNNINLKKKEQEAINKKKMIDLIKQSEINYIASLKTQTKKILSIFKIHKGNINIKHLEGCSGLNRKQIIKVICRLRKKHDIKTIEEGNKLFYRLNK